MDQRRLLFLASCVALIATAMTFVIRGDILASFESEYVVPALEARGADVSAALVETWKGHILTIAFWSFGLFIVFGGPLVDHFGMGTLLRLAAACHVGGVLMTIFAPNYWVLLLATFIVGAVNGLVEAVCNPLIATIYPDDKIHRLTRFHAWFPGGIVIGGVLAWLFTKMGFDWQWKMGLILIPAVIYTIMILPIKFPPTERVAAGYSFSQMWNGAIQRPLFWIIAVMMLFTAVTELVTGGWIPNIYSERFGAQEGVLLLVWGNGLMYILREFFSKPAHKLSPILLIAVTAPLAAIGTYMLASAQTPAVFFIAGTLLYLGVAFWWPTMLGITAERCPQSGALGLALVGGIGSFSTAVGGPAFGFLIDKHEVVGALQRWAAVPALITVVFLGLFLYDHFVRGGYKPEKLVNEPEGLEAPVR